MNDDQNSDKENLWSRILTEVQQHNIKSLPVRKNVIVLGNHNCGKTTLIAALQNATEIKCGVGLEYHYLDVKDESLDTTSKLGVWILDGDPYHSNLLKFALNEENFAHTMIVLMVSITEPWYMLEALEQWMDVVEKHVLRLKLTPEERERFQRSLVRHFQMYEEPVTDVEAKPNDAEVTSGTKKSTKEATAASKQRHNVTYNPLHPEDEEESANKDTATTGEKVTLPLPEGVLQRNLGIPVIIVVNKTDCMEALEREHDYRDEHFDFIQVHMRKFCLKYGASLVYTSVKDRKNCALLARYLKHRIYDFVFPECARIGEREAIFVPTGWDNMKKINILAESLSGNFCSPETLFNDVISRPTITLQSLRAGTGGGVTGGSGGGAGAGGASGGTASGKVQDAEIFVEDDQVFLMRQQALIQRQQAAGQEAGQPGAGAAGGGGSAPDTPMSPMAGGRQAPFSTARPGSGRAKMSSPAGGVPGTPGAGGNDVVLVNFFNSLLNKRGGAVGPGPGGRGGLTRHDSSVGKPLRERSVSPNTTNKEAPNSPENPAAPATEVLSAE